jgi:hypothetical protein
MFHSIAGGEAVFLHADFIRTMVPDAKFRAVPDAG